MKMATHGAKGYVQIQGLQAAANRDTLLAESGGGRTLGKGKATALSKTISKTG